VRGLQGPCLLDSSTNVGQGIASPHAKLLFANQIAIVICRPKQVFCQLFLNRSRSSNPSNVPPRGSASQTFFVKKRHSVFLPTARKSTVNERVMTTPYRHGRVRESGLLHAPSLQTSTLKSRASAQHFVDTLRYTFAVPPTCSMAHAYRNRPARGLQFKHIHLPGKTRRAKPLRELVGINRHEKRRCGEASNMRVNA